MVKKRKQIIGNFSVRLFIIFNRKYFDLYVNKFTMIQLERPQKSPNREKYCDVISTKLALITQLAAKRKFHKRGVKRQFFPIPSTTVLTQIRTVRP